MKELFKDLWFRNLFKDLKVFFIMDPYGRGVEIIREEVGRRFIAFVGEKYQGNYQRFAREQEEALGFTSTRTAYGYVTSVRDCERHGMLAMRHETSSFSTGELEKLSLLLKVLGVKEADDLVDRLIRIEPSFRLDAA